MPPGSLPIHWLAMAMAMAMKGIWAHMLKILCINMHTFFKLVQVSVRVHADIDLIFGYLGPFAAQTISE